jgi:hypothetical protein
MQIHFEISGFKQATIDNASLALTLIFTNPGGTELKLTVPAKHLCDLSGMVQQAGETFLQRQEGEPPRKHGTLRELWTRETSKIDVEILPMIPAVSLIFDVNTGFQIAYRLQPEQANQVAAALLQRSAECGAAQGGSRAN